MDSLINAGNSLQGKGVPEMSAKVAKGTGKYLYAIVADGDGQNFGPIGLEGGMVYSQAKGRVAAVISDLPNGKIRPERRHLAAHQKVLQVLMEKTTPLPMTFGIVATSPEKINQILARNQKAFTEQLQRVAAKVEMGLRVNWDVPNIFEYFVYQHAELRAARDRLAAPQSGSTQDDKIELGRMFERVLREDRESFTEKVEELLVPQCYEIKRNPPRNEAAVMSLACLVGRERLAAFEEAVQTAAGQFDNHFVFDYNGPWAPHNFVEVELQL